LTLCPKGWRLFFQFRPMELLAVPWLSAFYLWLRCGFFDFFWSIAALDLGEQASVPVFFSLFLNTNQTFPAVALRLLNSHCQPWCDKSFLSQGARMYRVWACRPMTDWNNKHAAPGNLSINGVRTDKAEPIDPAVRVQTLS